MQRLAQKSAVCYKVKYIVIYVPVTSLIDLLLGKLIPLYTCMLSHFSCTRLCDTMDSSVHGIHQARILELVACPLPEDLSNQGWKLHLISCLLHWQAGSLPPGSPTYMHIYGYIGVLTLDLLQQAKIQIPINKRTVKDGIYACSQLLCICINAAQINFNIIMLSERLLI